MGAIVTIPAILFFMFAKSKLNKEPKLVQYRQSPALKGNPKQNGQPVGISSTVGSGAKFKKHEDWINHIRNERSKIHASKL
jgi:hypothetical protein